MITDKTVKQLFNDCQQHFQLKEYWHSDVMPPILPQFFRGVATRLLNKRSLVDTRKHKAVFDCRRHILVFNKYNIIPKYCFNCFKIVIEVKTVVDLFKLIILFEKKDDLGLFHDNTRKCMVDPKVKIPKTYKGYIYSRDIKEAKILQEKVKKIIFDNISEKNSVSLKRGCTSFSLVHPKFAQIDKNGKPVMKYSVEWKKYDILAYKNNFGAPFEPPPDTYNHSGYNLNDYLAMLTFVKYAATIGDLSYRDITKLPITRFNC